MTEKLEITEKRFDEINEKLTDINVINDQEQYKSCLLYTSDAADD